MRNTVEIPLIRNGRSLFELDVVERINVGEQVRVNRVKLLNTLYDTSLALVPFLPIPIISIILSSRPPLGSSA